MQAIRCRCGKIVCQVANMPALPQLTEMAPSVDGPSAVILCRHCKRYVVLRFPNLSAIAVTSDLGQIQERHLVSS